MLARYAHPWVVPLEVWDVAVGGARLCEAPRDATFGARLLELALGLSAGELELSGGAPPPAELRGVTRLVLTGGAAESLVLPTVAGLIVEVDPEGAFAAERAGRAALGPAGGLVADVGQTAIKILSGGRRQRAPRDLDALPPNAPLSPASRERFIDFVAGALSAAIDGELRPTGLVLAMPCEVSPTCALGASSYPYEAGDPTLLDELLERAGLTRAHVLVANDAELAAASITLGDAPLDPTLVLSVGFGVGAALITRPS